MKVGLLDVFQKIAPDVMGIVRDRYLLLRHISDAQPVGRRSLATLSGLSERVVRAHVDVLRRNGIVRFTTAGIELEAEGQRLMPELLDCFVHLNNLDDMQKQIRKELQLEHVYIVPGNSDRDKTAKEELGRKGAEILASLLGNSEIVAVSGGSTLAELAERLPEVSTDAVIVPARGGLGNHVKRQANYIASQIAWTTGTTSQMMHVPDGLNAAAIRLLLDSDKDTRRTVDLAKRADILLFGIGRADIMAKRRGADKRLTEYLTGHGAVGEALGCYCNLHGEIVHVSDNVGISLKDVQMHSHVIAVAGGTVKGEAIVSVMRACRKGTLVIDEGAAEKIMTLI